jgi:hypothetical protein
MLRPFLSIFSCTYHIRTSREKNSLQEVCKLAIYSPLLRLKPHNRISKHLPQPTRSQRREKKTWTRLVGGPLARQPWRTRLWGTTSVRWAAAEWTRVSEARDGIAFLSVTGGQRTTVRSIAGGDLRCN